MKIPYNTSIEVTKRQYEILMNNFSGIVAGREENGKYYIKRMLMWYGAEIKSILTK